VVGSSCRSDTDVATVFYTLRFILDSPPAITSSLAEQEESIQVDIDALGKKQKASYIDFVRPFDHSLTDHPGISGILLSPSCSSSKSRLQNRKDT
jgi:hypothetical protein